jgi:hypothetical protein
MTKKITYRTGIDSIDKQFEHEPNITTDEHGAETRHLFLFNADRYLFDFNLDRSKWVEFDWVRLF